MAVTIASRAHSLPGSPQHFLQSLRCRAIERKERAIIRYLYERLSEKEFQVLCGALISSLHRSTNVRCFPIGQPDGARDIAFSGKEGLVIYQVKWTAKPLQDAVSWLDESVRGEAHNIERLVREGATEYVLMTSVAGTATRDKGSIDKLDVRLRDYSTRFGMQ